jgi:hypothetical protein
VAESLSFAASVPTSESDSATASRRMSGWKLRRSWRQRWSRLASRRASR